MRTDQNEKKETSNLIKRMFKNQKHGRKVKYLLNIIKNIFGTAI